MNRVLLLKDVDYHDVEHDRFNQDPAAGAAHADWTTTTHRPAGWPVQVPLPGDDLEWAVHARAWLLDLLPPDFRARRVVHDPYVLTWMAARHTAHALAALRAGYRGVAVDLKPYAEPHVVEQLLETYRIEGRRLAAAAAAIKVVGRALRAQARPGTSGGS